MHPVADGIELETVVKHMERKSPRRKSERGCRWSQEVLRGGKLESRRRYGGLHPKSWTPNPI